MNSPSSAQTQPERGVIHSFDLEFARLHARSSALIQSTPSEFLYEVPRAANAENASQSIGEYVLRSAAVVEQTFGGITANLWDDPFEWTLPETLSSGGLVQEYLAEVEETRRKAFASFATDKDLLKRIAAPSGEFKSLIALLLDTLVRALAYQGKAVALVEAHSITRPGGFII